MNVSFLSLSKILLLRQTLLDVANQLPGPTMVYYDESVSEIVGEVSKILGMSRALLLSILKPRESIEEAPMMIGRVKSTVLIASQEGCSENLLRSLHFWRIWNARDPMLIITEKEDDSSCLLEAAWHLTRASNTTVFNYADPALAKFYTWFPFRRKECSNVSTITQLSKPRLFPVKFLNDLHGCPMVAYTSILKPMVADDVEGIETRIALTVAKKMNFSIIFKHLPGNEKVWNLLNESNFPINAMKMMFENEVDIIFCNLRILYESSRWAEYLPSHLEDEVSWFVPAPDYLPRSTAIFRAFTTNVWILALVGFVGAWLIASYLPYIETGLPMSGLTRAVALSLNLPITVPSSRSFKVFAVCMYVYSLHITTAYQSSLIGFLTDIPRERPIKTPEELAESDYEIEFLDGHRHIVEAHNEPFMRVLKHPNRSKFVPSLWLPNVAKGIQALLGPKLAFSYFINGNVGGLFMDQYGYPRILVLKQQLTTSALTMYMSLGHPLVPAFHRYLLYLLEGGLPGQFTRMESLPPVPTFRSRKPFDLHNVEGAYVVLGVLLLLSFVTFALELIFHLILKCWRGKVAPAQKHSGRHFKRDRSKRTWLSSNLGIY